MLSVLFLLLPLTVLAVVAAIRWQNLASDTRSVDAYDNVLKRLAVAAEMAPPKRKRKKPVPLVVPRTHVHVMPQEVAPLRPARAGGRAASTRRRSARKAS